MLRLLFTLVTIMAIAAWYYENSESNEQLELSQGLSTQVDIIEKQMNSTIDEVKDFAEKVGSIEETLNEQTKKLQDLVDSH